MHHIKRWEEEEEEETDDGEQKTRLTRTVLYRHHLLRAEESLGGGGGWAVKNEINLKGAPVFCCYTFNISLSPTFSSSSLPPSSKLGNSNIEVHRRLTPFHFDKHHLLSYHPLSCGAFNSDNSMLAVVGCCWLLRGGAIKRCRDLEEEDCLGCAMHCGGWMDDDGT